jgi:DNA-binding MarR family transcriptional regulator
MALRQSTVSNLIKKLRHRRLIRRTRDNIDARVVHLYLTADGARVVIKGRSAPHNVLLDTLEHLSVKTLRLLDRELTGLLDGARDGYIS